MRRFFCVEYVWLCRSNLSSGENSHHNSRICLLFHISLVLPYLHPQFLRIFDMKDTFFMGTIHPATGISFLFILLLFFAMMVITTLHAPSSDDHNTIVFSIGISLLFGGVLYFMFRTRTIKFDGREFILEDVRFRETHIPASHFHSINAALGPTSRIYKIRFTDGRSYFYVYDVHDEVYNREVYSSHERVAYYIRLTKQIKQAIENEKILVVKEKSLLNITPEKTIELHALLREVFGARPRPETLTIQHPDEPFTSRMLRRDIEAMDPNELTLEHTSTLLSHLDLLSNDGLLYLLPTMMNYIDRTTKEFATLYKKLEVLQTRVASLDEQRILKQTIDYLKDCENVMGMEW